MTQIQEVVRFTNVIKQYDTKIVLDNLSFSIQKGSIVGLLGPNGAGKTTSISAALGSVPINGGEINIFGEKLTVKARHIKRRIGVVPQEITIYDDLSLRENLEFFGGLYGVKGEMLKQNVSDVLDFIGLSEHGNGRPKKFSGGMKRRANIGCALVHKPELVIMDEPTVGIDPQSRNHILESVKVLGSQGVTILYTTHYLDEVESLCERILIMDAGKVIADGTAAELKASIAVPGKTATLEEVFLTLTGKNLRDKEEKV